MRQEVAEHPRVYMRTAFQVCVVVLVSSATLLCQSTNASLTGRITDPRKAVITEATVTVVNTGTRPRCGISR